MDMKVTRTQFKANAERKKTVFRLFLLSLIKNPETERGSGVYRQCAPAPAPIGVSQASKGRFPP